MARAERPAHQAGRPSPLVEKLERVGSRELEEQAAAAARTGIDFLPLLGGPRLPLPEHVREAAIATFDDARPQLARGLPLLRAEIRDLFSREHEVELDSDMHIAVTAGAMQALDVVFRTILSPGENVVIPAPEFFFSGPIRLAGCEPRYVSSSQRDGWSWNLDAISAAVDSRTRAIIFSNPTNPSGFLPDPEHIAAIGELARERDLVVISDESYDRMVWDEHEFTSAVTLANWQERFVIVRSLSKSYALAPYRVGYVVATAGLVDQFNKVIEWNGLYTSHLSQAIAAAAISGPQDWLAGLKERYETNRDRVFEAVNSSEWLSSARPAGSPFLFVDVSRLQALGVDPVGALLGVGIPTVAGRSFGVPTHVRLPFGGDQDTIDELVNRVRAFEPAA
jgi:aspartate/methionine/tyrosine aminotransferase